MLEEMTQQEEEMRTNDAGERHVQAAVASVLPPPRIGAGAARWNDLRQLAGGRDA
jgi:hypothetical protein